MVLAGRSTSEGGSSLVVPAGRSTSEGGSSLVVLAGRSTSEGGSSLVVLAGWNAIGHEKNLNENAPGPAGSTITAVTNNPGALTI